MIRPAHTKDIDTLVAIEDATFDSDRLSRRSFRHMLTKAHAANLVYEDDNGIQGYVMVLFNRGTSLARMYSLAVVPQARGRGIGRQLITAAEQASLDNDRVYMRLEVRPDNLNSIRLYEQMGYRRFGTLKDYYEDHADALRFEKRLVPSTPSVQLSVPYYEQTLDFTCGPASLMMAMKVLDDSLELNRRLELRLWRESTTIFMTSGHGGCGPYGLALSALHRGYDVELYVNEEGAFFIDSVRSEEKKEVVRLAHEDFMDEILASDITLHYRCLTLEEMKAKIDAGGIPVILISSYRIYREKFPHWVVVTGYDERFVYMHDSYIDYEKGKTVTDCINMPILQQDFKRMSRYGKSGQRAALILWRHQSKGAPS